MEPSKGILPSERWNLREIGRTKINDQEWVVYDDGSWTGATLARDFDNPTQEDDYSQWCADTVAAGDDKLCQCIASKVGLSWIQTAGLCITVYHNEKI